MRDKTILLIDDNEDILYTLAEICGFQGWLGLTAASYKEAKLFFQKHTIDLIIVDYHMPDLDGISTVKELRKIYEKTPIIVLTVEEQDSIVEKFMAAGANDYALKPIKAVDLISRMKVHLQYAEQSRYYDNHAKGISKLTLTKITNYLNLSECFVPAEDIERNTGIKIKTVYRYMQYMAKNGLVDTENRYGDTGRPQIGYRLRR